MRRVASTPPTVLAIVTLVLALGGCGQDDDAVVSDKDVYKVGCPAVDSGAAAGKVTKKVSAETLRQVKKRGGISDAAAEWLDTAIQVVESDNPQSLPKKVVAPVVEGCKKNGFALRNLG